MGSHDVRARELDADRESPGDTRSFPPPQCSTVFPVSACVSREESQCSTAPTSSRYGLLSSRRAATMYLLSRPARLPKTPTNDTKPTHLTLNTKSNQPGAHTTTITSSSTVHESQAQTCAVRFATLLNGKNSQTYPDPGHYIKLPKAKQLRWKRCNYLDLNDPGATFSGKHNAMVSGESFRVRKLA